MTDRLIAPENADVPRTREASSGVTSATSAWPVGGIAATAAPKKGPRAAMMAPAARKAPMEPAARAHTAAEKSVPAVSAKKRASRMTRLRPQAMERRPQNWLSAVTAAAARDTAAPTIHSGSSRARERGAIDTLSMFCAVYVNSAIATSARRVGFVSKGDEGTVHPTTKAPRVARGLPRQLSNNTEVR